MELTLDAKVKVGELTQAIPKATSSNNPSGLSKTQGDTAVKLGVKAAPNQKPKLEVIREAGFSPEEGKRSAGYPSRQPIAFAAHKYSQQSNNCWTADSFSL